jgi:hypothetical protein
MAIVIPTLTPAGRVSHNKRKNQLVGMFAMGLVGICNPDLVSKGFAIRIFHYIFLN